jgi:hypothetical protein
MKSKVPPLMLKSPNTFKMEFAVADAPNIEK